MLPPVVVPEADSPDPGGPGAPVHLAGRAAGDGIRRVDRDHLAPELQADRGHQLFQQAGGNPDCAGVRGVPGAPHQRSSSSSKTVAVTLTATPPRTPRACR